MTVVAKGEYLTVNKRAPLPCLTDRKFLDANRSQVMCRIISARLESLTRIESFFFVMIAQYCRYEWTNNSDNSSDENRCEIHYVRGNNFSHSSQNRDNTVCCWRVSTMNSKGGRRLDPVSRRQVSGHGRDRARKHRRQAVRIGQIGQKMDAPNARR